MIIQGVSIMKNLLHIILCLMAIHSKVSFAQNQMFGLRTGVNVSKVSSINYMDNWIKYATVPGYHFSGFVETQLQNNFNL